MLCFRIFFITSLTSVFLTSHLALTSSSEEQYAPYKSIEANTKILRSLGIKKSTLHKEGLIQNLNEVHLYAALAAYKHNKFYWHPKRNHWNREVPGNAQTVISPKSIVPLGQILRTLREVAENDQGVDPNLSKIITKLSKIGLRWAEEWCITHLEP